MPLFSDVIKEIGDENIKVQSLRERMVGSDCIDGKTTIEFTCEGINPVDILHNKKKAFIVIIDADDFDGVMQTK